MSTEIENIITLHGVSMDLTEFLEFDNLDAMRALVNTDVARACRSVPEALRARLVSIVYGKWQIDVLQYRYSHSRFPFSHFARKHIATSLKEAQQIKVLRAIDRKEESKYQVVTEAARLLEDQRNRHLHKLRKAAAPAARNLRKLYKSACLHRDEIREAEIAGALTESEAEKAGTLALLLTSPISKMLGYLKNEDFPLSSRPRGISIFESRYGLNGHTKANFSEVARQWGLDADRPRQIVQEIWHKLAISKAPIASEGDLFNLKQRIERLSKLARISIPVANPSDITTEQLQAIRSGFEALRVERKASNALEMYQPLLEISSVSLGGAKEETILGIVCEVFGITLEQLRSRKGTTWRISRARHVAMYLLHVKLDIPVKRVCVLVNRKRLMVCYGKCQIAEMIEAGDQLVVDAVNKILKLYRKVIRSSKKAVQA